MATIKRFEEIDAWKVSKEMCSGSKRNVSKVNRISAKIRSKGSTKEITLKPLNVLNA